MAKLDVIKTIECTRGKINSRYDLATTDFIKIYDYNSNPFYLIVNSFSFGYAQGMKAAKAEMKKGEKSI